MSSSATFPTAIDNNRLQVGDVSLPLGKKTCFAVESQTSILPTRQAAALRYGDQELGITVYTSEDGRHYAIYKLFLKKQEEIAHLVDEFKEKKGLFPCRFFKLNARDPSSDSSMQVYADFPEGAPDFAKVDFRFSPPDLAHAFSQDAPSLFPDYTFTLMNDSVPPSSVRVQWKEKETTNKQIDRIHSLIETMKKQWGPCSFERGRFISSGSTKDEGKKPIPVEKAEFLVKGNALFRSLLLPAGDNRLGIYDEKPASAQEVEAWLAQPELAKKQMPQREKERINQLLEEECAKNNPDPGVINDLMMIPGVDTKPLVSRTNNLLVAAMSKDPLDNEKLTNMIRAAFAIPGFNLAEVIKRVRGAGSNSKDEA